MILSPPRSSHNPTEELAELMRQAGSLIVVDAALISPAEAEQIQGIGSNSAAMREAMSLWDPELLALLANLCTHAQGEGSPESPPELPRPAYALLFEESLRELGLMTSASPAPWAYWQALADGVAADSRGHWLAVEPCQWQVSTQQVNLRPSLSNPPFSQHLIDQLKPGLDRLDASLVLGESGRAYLRFENAFDLQSAWPESLEGLGADDFLPHGERARDWRRFVTELEMALAINPDTSDTQSLWPWGMGAAPPNLPRQGPSETLNSTAFINESQSSLNRQLLSNAPLPLQGLQQWLVSQGQTITIEWRSFKSVETIDDWLSEWQSLFRRLQALESQGASPSLESGRPWAVLLQDRWSYKLYRQPGGRGRQSRPSSQILTTLMKPLVDLTQSLLPLRTRKTKDSSPLAQLLELASWKHAKDETSP